MCVSGLGVMGGRRVEERVELREVLAPAQPLGSDLLRLALLHPSVEHVPEDGRAEHEHLLANPLRSPKEEISAHETALM